MSRFTKALTVLTVCFLGLLGCAQGPANSTAQADRVKTLEAKCSRLEEDYRTVAVARDQARKQASSLEEEKTQLLKEVDQLRLVVKERDRLRQELEVKTTQRDSLQARCDKLKAGIRNLMSEDDAMLPTPPNTNVSASNTAASR